MPDLKIEWNTALNEGDLTYEINAGDLSNDDGLTTAVLISLCTDRRARDEDTLPDPNSLDKRGWWGDLLSPEVTGDEIGCRQWLFIERAKALDSVVIDIKESVIESLQWLIEDGVASSIEVETEKVGSFLYLLIKIKKIDETTNTYSIKFDSNWNAQFNDE